MPLRFIHATLAGRSSPCCVTVDPSLGTIVGVEEASPSSLDAGAGDIDCGGALLAPGLIDLQLNGALGVDFSDASLTVADVQSLLTAVCRGGVTSVVATLITNNAALYASVVPVLRTAYHSQPAWPCASAPPRARLLGLHLEGPWLHVDKRGAHDASSLSAPPVGAGEGGAAEASLASLLAPYSLSEADVACGLVRAVTLAPELPGAHAAIAALSAAGIAVAIGHTTSDYAGAVAAMQAGASFVTHCWNAMRPMHHREPGVLGLLGWRPSAESPAAESPAASEEPPEASPLRDGPLRSGQGTPVPFAGGAAPPPARPYFSLIADGGVHVHPAVLALTHRAAAGRTLLVTDAMRAMGLPAGPYLYGPLAVTVRAGGPGQAYGGLHAVLTGTDTLAGAVLPLGECLRYYAAATGAPPQEALATVTTAPAALLRMQSIGQISVGAAADLVLMDPELRVQRVWVGGVEVE